MKLTLEEAEEKLIEKGLITRDEIEKDKREKRFGKSKCRVLLRFKRAVENDEENFFFPEKPDSKNFNDKAARLFRNGGKRINQLRDCTFAATVSPNPCLAFSRRQKFKNQRPTQIQLFR